MIVSIEHIKPLLFVPLSLSEKKLKKERSVTLLGTCSNQFGFKNCHTTALCIYAINEIINYTVHWEHPCLGAVLKLRVYVIGNPWKTLLHIGNEASSSFLIIILLSSWCMRQRLSAEYCARPC